MTVNTKKVKDRRAVHYESFDDLLADAERLAAGDVHTLGNWSYGQILKHVAKSLDSSIDGVGFMLPGPVRLVMKMFMKRRFLTKPLPSGFKTTKAFLPAETSVEDGLAALRAAIARQSRETERALHPAFGRISRQEWDQFNLRHAEMHMSFVVPGG
jgi:Protein of unknown function (DUF1569)